MFKKIDTDNNKIFKNYFIDHIGLILVNKTYKPLILNPIQNSRHTFIFIKFSGWKKLFLGFIFNTTS